MSASLPFYLITHRCGDGVYTDESRIDTPDSWQQFVDLMWTGEKTDVASIWKITPPSHCYKHGRVEDVTHSMVNALTDRSFRTSEEPGSECLAFLKAHDGDWYVEETENDIMIGRFFKMPGRAA